MIIEQSPVVIVEQLRTKIYALSFRSTYITDRTQPGQFVNIKVAPGQFPLLRRPFSIADIDGDIATIIFDVVGEGTHLLSQKSCGDTIDVLGPLGKGFTLADPVDTAILVGGGLGMAPLPLLAKRLRERGVSNVHTFLGARTANLIVNYKFSDIRIATDDGSEGVKGTVVELLDMFLAAKRLTTDIFVFGCGPNRMLESLKNLLRMRNIRGEASLECVMACGIGICQGCPVETEGGAQKYKLVCKDGPVFDLQSVIIP
jgi:dihydroorotate dehydrogenase electron transfer subunit